MFRVRSLMITNVAVSNLLAGFRRDIASMQCGDFYTKQKRKELFTACLDLIKTARIVRGNAQLEPVFLIGEAV